MSEPEAVGVILGFEASEPPPVYQPPPSRVPVEPLPLPTLMPTRDEDGRWNTSNLEDVLEWKPRGDFVFVGWSYERDPADTCVCLKCGNDRFLVGCSNALLTILKCPNCGWERVVHDG